MEMASPKFDRLAELKAFDDTKAGVKGLVDAGISTVPCMFIYPQDDQASFPAASKDNINIPVIDLTGVETDANQRKAVVDEIKDAAETWGFFQVVNHGVPVMVLEEMLEGVQRFFEQDIELKKGYYSRVYGKKVKYNSNFDLYSGSPVNWRDSITFTMAPDPPQPEELPTCCREIVPEYSKQVLYLGKVLFELISEALGLQTSHLNEMGCGGGLTFLGQYYPPCPEPHLTMGCAMHCDADFLTVLLQDQVGGLQILHDNHWVDVPPVRGALVVNIGDILQLISNDKCKSAVHRVVANNTKVSRVSVAGFFRDPYETVPRLYRPIKDLTSKDNPPRYREATMKEIEAYRADKGLAGSICTLAPFRLKE